MGAVSARSLRTFTRDVECSGERADEPWAQYRHARPARLLLIMLLADFGLNSGTHTPRRIVGTVLDASVLDARDCCLLLSGRVRTAGEGQPIAAG